MEITSAQVKALRDATGAGMMDSKRALQEADGDFERAKQILREAGKAGITKRAGRTASEGVVESYLHRPDPNLPPKLGVLVELDCETDFVALTDEFRRLARDIAMHVAAADPTYVSREAIPGEVLERERKIDGKLKDFYKQVVLLDQPFIRDQDKTIQELLDAYSDRVRERLVLRRFSRYKVGEEA